MATSIPAHNARDWNAARWAVAISLALHGALVALLASSAISGLRPMSTSPIVTVTSEPVSSTSPSTERTAKGSPAVTIAPESRPPDKLDSSVVQARLSAALAAANQSSADENFEQLGRLGTRLEHVTSEQSLDEVAQRLKDWMGLSERVTTPRESTTFDRFDFDSAQFHEVRREKPATEGATARYLAVLIDRAGRTVEIEMGQADGAAAYELMRRVKANPLLEKLYRGIAMPLLDQLVGPLRAGSASSSTSASPSTPARGEGRRRRSW